MLAFATRFNPGYFAGAEALGPPMQGWVTQVFGQLSVSGNTHGGIDIAAPQGTPIYAPAPGAVALIQPASMGYAFGNWVTLDHEGTPWYSAYAHMSAFAELELGQHVETGDLLGYCGSTGLSTGPHLHWGVGKSAWFPLDFTILVDPAQFISAEEEEDEMTAQQLEMLRLMSDLLAGDPPAESADADGWRLARLRELANTQDLQVVTSLQNQQREFAKHVQDGDSVLTLVAEAFDAARDKLDRG